MSLIRWRHNGLRLVVSAVVTPPTYASNASQQIRVNGLLDTGATSSGIRADLVEALSLKAKGSKRVSTANGLLMAAEHLVRIGFLIGDYLDPNFDPDRVLPYILEPPVVAFELQSGFAYPLLIGMDVIATGDLHVGRDGVATLKL